VESITDIQQVGSMVQDAETYAFGSLSSAIPSALLIAVKRFIFSIFSVCSSNTGSVVGATRAGAAD
jgi:hypothetical protein